MRRRARPLAAFVAAVAVAMLVSALPLTRAADSGLRPTAAAATPDRPNIVLVVLDDFSMELQTLRSAREMRAWGASYPHAFVVDSLCCVSRASTFTGQYPH